MAKNKSRTSKTQVDMKIVGGVALLIIAAVAAVILLRPADANSSQAAAQPSVQNIAAQTYVSDFVNTPAQHILIDVRTPEEFASGHIPGAVNISVESLAGRLSEVPTDQPVVVYCRSGNRSATASQILASAGYDDIYDLGAIIAWANAGLPIE